MRQTLVAGNWKMHGSRASVEKLMQGLLEGAVPNDVDMVLCPAFVHLDQVIDVVADSAFTVGAQDCSAAESGAYTGEIAAPMLADLGCQWVILGHSERRSYHSESDALVAAKLDAAVAAGLNPIVCVGETQSEREAGNAEAIVSSQLCGALSGRENLESLVVAYEPVWAIGTGLTATPEQAQDMHAFIRQQLAEIDGVNSAATRILYGGSVKADNAVALFAAEDIDGALVGGASLVAADFRAIIDAAAS